MILAQVLLPVRHTIGPGFGDGRLPAIRQLVRDTVWDQLGDNDRPRLLSETQRLSGGPYCLVIDVGTPPPRLILTCDSHKAAMNRSLVPAGSTAQTSTPSIHGREGVATVWNLCPFFLTRLLPALPARIA